MNANSRKVNTLYMYMFMLAYYTWKMYSMHLYRKKVVQTEKGFRIILVLLA